MRESREINALGTAMRGEGNAVATGENDPHEDEGRGAESGEHTQDSGGLQI